MLLAAWYYIGSNSAFAPITLLHTQLVRSTHESLVISVSCKIHLVVSALVLGLTYAQAEAKTFHIADAHHTPILSCQPSERIASQDLIRIMLAKFANMLHSAHMIIELKYKYYCYHS